MSEVVFSAEQNLTAIWYVAAAQLMTGDHHNASGDAAETDRGLGGSQVSPGNYRSSSWKIPGTGKFRLRMEQYLS